MNRRWGMGQAPTSNPFGRGGLRRHLSDYDRDKCLKCGVARWYHRREGIVPDHEFVGDKPEEEAKP